MGTGGTRKSEPPCFAIPRPEPMTQPKVKFRVTEFRDYLASPYRYYLRHVLRLQELTDAIDELDAAGFGNLIHAVLKEFGDSDVKDATEPAVISEFLSQSLEQVIDQIYGSDPLYPVLVQKEQALVRLKAFARWQADWRRQGWEIRFAENRQLVAFPFEDGAVMGRRGDEGQPDPMTDSPSSMTTENDEHRFSETGDSSLLSPSPPSPVPTPPPGTVFLSGQIDRIDYNERLQQWAILDYKTGESAKAPEQTHRTRGGEWIDLQLPLYRHLACGLGVEGEVLLGYVTIPRDTSEIHEKLVEWTAEELDEADGIARETIRRVLNQEFWQEVDALPGYESEFSAICQDTVFGREATV